MKKKRFEKMNEKGLGDKTLTYEHGTKKNFLKGVGLVSVLGVVGFSARYLPYRNILNSFKERSERRKKEVEKK